MDTQINIVKERERVAEMCARCDIEYAYYHKTNTSEWIARMWCNTIGSQVVAVADTAWAAVQAVHALHAMHSKE